MIALDWDMTCRQDLICMGFRLREVMVRYLDGPATQESVTRGVTDMLSLKGETPFQFAVSSYWERDKKEAGVVQVAITLRPGTDETLSRKGFKKALVFVKHGALGPTKKATPKNEREFLSMSYLPNRWYANSYWGSGSG